MNDHETTHPERRGIAFQNFEDAHQPLPPPDDSKERREYKRSLLLARDILGIYDL